MKYKVDPASELYEKLKQFKQRHDTVYKEIEDFVKSIGGEAFSVDRSFAVIGRINGIKFSNEPDKNMWKPVGPKHMSLYMPKSKNHLVLSGIGALPVINLKEYDRIFGDHPTQAITHGDGLGFFTSPGCKFSGENILLSVPNNVIGYLPAPGMIEILESEYNKLLEDKDHEPKN